MSDSIDRQAAIDAIITAACFLAWLDGTAFSHEDYMRLCEEYAKDRWKG